MTRNIVHPIDTESFMASRRSGSILVPGLDLPIRSMEEVDVRFARPERLALAIPGSSSFSYQGVATVTTAGTVSAETGSQGSSVKTTCTDSTGNVAEIVFPTFTRRQYGPSVTFLFYTALLNSRKIIALADTSPGAVALDTTDPATVLNLASSVNGVGFVSQYRVTTNSSGSVALTVDATAKTFTRTDSGPPAGDFIVDGWRVGDTVTWSGAAPTPLSAGNTGANVITALTPTVMTFGNATGLVSESAYGFTATGTEYLKIWGCAGSTYVETTTDFQLVVGETTPLRVTCIDTAANTWEYDVFDKTTQRWKYLGQIDLPNSGLTKTLTLNAYFQIVNSDWRASGGASPPGANSGNRAISVLGIRHR